MAVLRIVFRGSALALAMRLAVDGEFALSALVASLFIISLEARG